MNGGIGQQISIRMNVALNIGMLGAKEFARQETLRFNGIDVCRNLHKICVRRSLRVFVSEQIALCKLNGAVKKKVFTGNEFQMMGLIVKFFRSISLLFGEV